MAFDKDSVELKKDIAQAFVPTVNGIKNCYSMLEEQDKAYGKGVLMLNATLKEYELTSVATEDKLKEAHSSVQVGVYICAYSGSLDKPRTRLRCCSSNSGKTILNVTDSGLRYKKGSSKMVILKNQLEIQLRKLIFIILVEPVADLLKGTPANIERVITALDKVRTRAVEKDEGNSTMYTEQMLKGLLKSLEQA